MIYKYEMACKEAGLSEEKIAQIRQVFDSDYKRLDRRKKAMEDTGISWISVTDLSGEGQEQDFELEDLDMNVEESVIRSITLHELREYLQELQETDRDFLYGCFSDYADANRRMAEKFGMTVDQVRYKKKKLIQQLRQRFEGN